MFEWYCNNVTNKIASLEVGEGMLGRVVDGMGRPIDGKGTIA